MASVVSGFTVTWKLNSISLFPSNTMFPHEISPSVSDPSFVIEPGTSVVPSGIASVTVVIPSTSDIFVNFIVYCKVSFDFTSLSSKPVSVTTLAIFSVIIIGVSTFSVSFPFTFAIFSIVSIFSPTTFTLNETVILFSDSRSTFHVIVPSFSVPLLLIESGTNSVPSGMLSSTRILAPSTLPVFVTFISYVIISPI